MKTIQALSFTGTFALVLACVSGCGESEEGAVLQGASGGRDASAQGGSSSTLSGGRSTSTGGRAGGSTGISRGGSSETSAGAAGEQALAGSGGDDFGSGGVTGLGGSTGTTPRGGSSGTGTPAGAGGVGEAGADAGGADQGGAAGADAGGAGGAAAAECPNGVPAHKAPCAEAQSCSYVNMVCVCGGDENERHWTCDPMERCPPKLPVNGAECRLSGSQPPSCAYTDGSVCSCDAQAKWQCTP